MLSFQNSLYQDSDDTLKKRLMGLDSAYFSALDSQNRQNILLAIDEVIIQMMKRGIYDKSIHRSI